MQITEVNVHNSLSSNKIAETVSMLVLKQRFSLYKQRFSQLTK